MIASKDEFFHIYVNTPQKTFLSKKYNNQYITKYYENLKNIGLKTPQINILGKEPESVRLCTCNKSEDYVLFTNYLLLESPLRCYDCFGVIPLYKIPKSYFDEYYDILS